MEPNNREKFRVYSILSHTLLKAFKNRSHAALRGGNFGAFRKSFASMWVGLKKAKKENQEMKTGRGNKMKIAKILQYKILETPEAVRQSDKKCFQNAGSGFSHGFTFRGSGELGSSPYRHSRTQGQFHPKFSCFAHFWATLGLFPCRSSGCHPSIESSSKGLLTDGLFKDLLFWNSKYFVCDIPQFRCQMAKETKILPKGFQTMATKLGHTTQRT